MVTDYLTDYAEQLANTLATLSDLEIRVLEVAFGFFGTDLVRYSKDGQRKIKVNLSELGRILQSEYPEISRSRSVTLYRSVSKKLQESGFLDLYREICEAIGYRQQLVSF